MVVFDFSQLIVLIINYGFKNFCRDSGIELTRLIDVLDGISYFALNEIDAASQVLNIPDNKQDRIFFTKKVDLEQL